MNGDDLRKGLATSSRGIPGGILIPKIGELSSSAPLAENVIAPITLTPIVAAITKTGICFKERPSLRRRCFISPDCFQPLNGARAC